MSKSLGGTVTIRLKKCVVPLVMMVAWSLSSVPRTLPERSLRGGPSRRSSIGCPDHWFFSIKRIRALKRVKAFFISRLKSAVNPEVFAVPTGMVTLKNPTGRKFLSLRFEGSFVDLDVRFGSGSEAFAARVLGVWNQTSKEYHWLPTYLSDELHLDGMVGFTLGGEG